MNSQQKCGGRGGRPGPCPKPKIKPSGGGDGGTGGKPAKPKKPPKTRPSRDGVPQTKPQTQNPQIHRSAQAWKSIADKGFKLFGAVSKRLTATVKVLQVQVKKKLSKTKTGREILGMCREAVKMHKDISGYVAEAKKQAKVLLDKLDGGARSLQKAAGMSKDELALHKLMETLNTKLTALAKILTKLEKVASSI